MNASQATDALTEAVCRHSLQARAQKRKARIIVATAARLAPSREEMLSNGYGEYVETELLKAAVKSKIAREGTIVIGLVGTIFLLPFALNILIAVIAGLIVKWIWDGRQEAALIQQARG